MHPFARDGWAPLALAAASALICLTLAEGAAAAEEPVAEIETFGIGGTLTRRHYEDQSAKDGAVLVSGSHYAYDTRTIFSGRHYGFGFIGGGSAGFEGGLGGELAFGLRLPFGKNHGPVARTAIEASLMGNDSFYFSALRLPKGEFGYQLLSRQVLVEAAVTASPLLTGFYNVEGAPRRPLAGLFQLGGHLALGFRAAHLELALNRLETVDHAVGPINELTSSLCGLPSVFAVCAEVRYLAGGAHEPHPDARVAYLGFRAGVIVPHRAPPRTPKAPKPPR